MTQARKNIVKLRDIVSVKDFGADGDGDDYAAFAAALAANAGGTVFVPDTPNGYLIGTGTLTIPANTRLVGQTRHVTKLTHGFNGNMFNMSEGAIVENFYIDGNGATYTGRCFQYSGSAGRQKTQGVLALDFDDEVMYFETNAGSQSTHIDNRMARINAGTGTERYAVVIDPAQQLAARPRKFIAIETNGTCAFDFGGSNNTYVANSFLGDLKYGVESRGVFVVGSRVSNQAALTIDGDNNACVGCGFAPQVTIAAGTTEICLEGNYYNILPVIDLSGTGRTIVSHHSVDYTPALTSSGTAPDIGNGTITAEASRAGNLVSVTINFTLGSTTTLGSGELRFSLPTWAPCSANKIQSCGFAVLTGGATTYTAVAQQIGAASQYLRLLRDTSSTITATSPVTWATGDTFRITATYAI